MRRAPLLWTPLLVCGCLSSEQGSPAPNEPIATDPSFPLDAATNPFGGADASLDPDAQIGGADASDSMQVARFPPTTRAAIPPPPIRGGSMQLTPDGQSLIVADPDRDSVAFVAVPQLTLTWMVTLTSGDRPGRSTVDASGRIHVVLGGAGSVATLDPANGTILARRSVCAAPRGIGYLASSGTVYVACQEGLLASYDAALTGSVRTVVVEPDLRDVVILTNSIWLSKFRSAEALNIDPSGTILTRVAPPTTATMAQSQPEVAWRMISASLPNTVAMIHQRVSTIPVMTTPGAYGQNSDCSPSIVQASLSLMGDAANGSVIVPDTVLPVDVARSPTTGLFAIAAAGNAYGSGGGVVIVSAPNDGSDPSCTMPDESLLFDTFTVVAVAFDHQGSLYAQTRQPSQVFRFPADIYGAPITRSEVLSLSSVDREDTGHTIFHTFAGAAIACASCHPEGQSDGRTWHFDNLGPRRTPSLLGTIEGTAPYHWDGSLADMGALIDEVYLGRMGGMPLAPDQRDTLQQWVFALPAPIAPPPADPASVMRGEALFHGSAACFSCHNGPHLTNNLNMDVGTGGSFQVPSLIGVRWETSLLHDGCAHTLADRFGSCSTPQHGDTAMLTASDVADLIAYLETL
jgi:hypothetical protein